MDTEENEETGSETAKSPARGGGRATRTGSARRTKTKPKKRPVFPDDPTDESAGEPQPGPSHGGVGVQKRNTTGQGKGKNMKLLMATIAAEKQQNENAKKKVPSTDLVYRGGAVRWGP